MRIGNTIQQLECIDDPERLRELKEAGEAFSRYMKGVIRDCSNHSRKANLSASRMVLTR